MTRHRHRERSPEKEGRETSCGEDAHKPRRSRSERPLLRRLGQGGGCGPPKEAAEANLQPYVIRGGQRVRCRCGKRDGLQDDLPPLKKEDCSKVSSGGTPKRPLARAEPPCLPIEDPPRVPARGPPQLPDVCPLCRSPTYNLPNLLHARGAHEPTRLALEARSHAPAPTPSEDAPMPPCPGPRLWEPAHRRAPAGCACRLQCCGEAAADIAQQIERSLQSPAPGPVDGLDVKSDAKTRQRRDVARGAREAERRSASVPLKAPHGLKRSPERGALTGHLRRQQSATYYTHTEHAKDIQRLETASSVVDQQSKNSSSKIYRSGSMNCAKNVTHAQSPKRTGERCPQASTNYSAAGDESSSPGLLCHPQYRCNWWCMTQPGERLAWQNHMIGHQRQIGTEQGALKSPYAVVCQHHPQWHAFCECVHRIPLALQTPAAEDGTIELEAEYESSSVSPRSWLDFQNNCEKSSTETNICESTQQSSLRNAKETDIASKDVVSGNFEPTKKPIIHQARETSTQTIISCVKNVKPCTSEEKTFFASRGTVYCKVDESLQPINPSKRDSGAQTILTVAHMTTGSAVGSSCTASKGTVCGSFVRSIAPRNSARSVSGAQAICPDVRRLIPSGDQSVRTTAKKGTVCSRSERAVQWMRPQRREIATQAGGTILQQLRASRSLERARSAERPISRPRSLTPPASDCSSVADGTTNQCGKTFPLLSHPEDVVGLPYVVWPSALDTPSNSTCETLRDCQCVFQSERDVLKLNNGGDICSMSISPLKRVTSQFEGSAKETNRLAWATAVPNQPENNHQADDEEPPRQCVSDCKGRAGDAEEEQRESERAAAGSALQPKCLPAESENPAQSARAAAVSRPRPPLKRPLEVPAPALQAQFARRGTNQKLRSSAVKSAGCAQHVQPVMPKEVKPIGSLGLQNG